MLVTLKTLSNPRKHPITCDEYRTLSRLCLLRNHWYKQCGPFPATSCWKGPKNINRSSGQFDSECQSEVFLFRFRDQRFMRSSASSSVHVRVPNNTSRSHLCSGGGHVAASTPVMGSFCEHDLHSRRQPLEHTKKRSSSVDMCCSSDWGEGQLHSGVIQ